MSKNNKTKLHQLTGSCSGWPSGDANELVEQELLGAIRHTTRGSDCLAYWTNYRQYRRNDVGGGVVPIWRRWHIPNEETMRRNRTPWLAETRQTRGKWQVPILKWKQNDNHTFHAGRDRNGGEEQWHRASIHMDHRGSYEKSGVSRHEWLAQLILIQGV